MAKKKKLREVSPGQRILSAYSQRDLLILRDYKVDGEQDLKRLKNLGVSRVVVETETDSAPDEVEETFDDVSERMENVQTETEKSEILYEMTVQNLKKFFAKVEKERPVRPDRLRPYVDALLERSLRDPTGLTALTQIEEYDFDTFRHSLNVGILCVLYGRHKDYSEARTREFALGGLLHDVGKVKIPEEIITRHGKLSQEEFELVKKHSEAGRKILEKLGADRNKIQIAHQHHERPDGTGYPQGIKNYNNDALKVSVFDVYDALVSRRVYKQRLGANQAFETLVDEFGDHPGPRAIVRDLLNCLGVFPVGSLVRLTNGELGVVHSHHPGEIKEPVVCVIVDSTGKTVNSPYLLDLRRLEQQKVMRQGKIYDEPVEVKESVSLDQVKKLAGESVLEVFEDLQNHQLSRL